ncbi:MAG: AbrB/MazE/SpoVT family DNA-binding domain-containing protein [Candidatus Brockarchaeota archaeon]|nr:AbrB/MazE/SpoVT family DNA-binding domain-containing protein [Candidatus Brockarchaeota archaeon]MBO3842295.1 AbrB/MazE/SpoVT family DNA-binding domain-containing protein [Candidatus Brockarchaeota archaeon]
MGSIVKVTRRGQTTIPVKLRKKYGIKEGDKLLIEDAKEGLIIKIIPRLEELAGVDAEIAKPEEVKKEIEKLREEW